LQAVLHVLRSAAVGFLLELIANALTSWLFFPERWARWVALPVLLLVVGGAIYLIVGSTD
jgi:hypothetical protein